MAVPEKSGGIFSGTVSDIQTAITNAGIAIVDHARDNLATPALKQADEILKERVKDVFDRAETLAENFFGTFEDLLSRLSFGPTIKPEAKK